MMRRRVVWSPPECVPVLKLAMKGVIAVPPTVMSEVRQIAYSVFDCSEEAGSRSAVLAVIGPPTVMLASSALSALQVVASKVAFATCAEADGAGTMK